MDTLARDIRYAVRQVVRQKGWSLVAILTLALGIGASTAVFSVIDAAMLHPLPYPDPEQLVRVNVAAFDAAGNPESIGTPSMDDMRLWEAADDVFASVAGWGRAFRGGIVEGEHPERVAIFQFTEDYLSMHGVAPLLGRDFDRDDMEYAAPAVVMLGYGYWQSRYAGRRDVLGETIRLDDGPATIVGVLPASFSGSTQLFRPLRVPPEEVSQRGTGRLAVFGRLRPGITPATAEERLAARMADLPVSGPVRELGAEVISRIDSAVERSSTTFGILLGAVGLILLLASVNVAGLLLARGAARQAEIAVRASLGAGPVRLLRQLLTESLVLGLAGAGAGVLLAWSALDAITAVIPVSMPDSPASVNPRVLFATLVVLIGSVIAFGLVPALRLARARIGAAVVLGGRALVGSPLSRRGGQWLIGAEMALAVVLVAGAGLMLRTYGRLTSLDLGFDPEGRIAMQVLPLSPDIETHRAYYPELLARLGALSEIRSAGVVDNFPLGGVTSFSDIVIDGEASFGMMFDVLPGYFETMDIELLEGRLPTIQDYASRLRGAVLNRTAAELFEGGAVGRQFTRQGQDEPWTVLGVVADVRHGGPLGDDRFPGQTYLLFEPNEFSLNEAMTIVIEPSGRALDGALLRQTAESIGPPVLIESVRSANDWFADRIVTPRRRTILLGLLGGLGLALALVGVFGTTAYAVSRRRGEIGVRMAFGATPLQVVMGIAREAALPIAIGTVIGLAGAASATRVLRSFLFETEPTDPATFAAVAVTLVVAGCLAALIPARRAARIDPARTLREE